MFFRVLNNFKDERKIIIILAVIVILIISLIKIINNNIKNQNINSSSSINTTTAINASINNNFINTNNTNTTNGNYQEYSITTPYDCLNIFIYYCNNNQPDKAYNMLTDDCKNLLYNTKEKFYQNYYKRIFAGSEKQVSYIKNKYDENVYKLTVKEDPLSTGNIDESNNIVDTVTVVNDNGTYKINVSDFIKKETFNINKSNSYIDVFILEKTIYTDYELYKIKVKNKTKADIVLSEMNSKTDISIQDRNEDNYYIDNDDYIQEQVMIASGNEKILNLKINKVYNNKDTIKMIFSKIRIINKAYYDESEPITDERTGNVTYKQKYSNYVPEFSFERNFE